MRNPERLDKLYSHIKNLHQEYVPDLRFMQLILDFLNWHYQNYGNDGFYIEDETFDFRFSNFISELTYKGDKK